MTTFINFFCAQDTNMTLTALQGPLKWGFFGAGKITSDFVTVLNALSAHAHPKPQHISLGVAARDSQKAKIFAEIHGIKKSFQSYSHLVKDPEIGYLSNSYIFNYFEKRKK